MVWSRVGTGDYQGFASLGTPHSLRPYFIAKVWRKTRNAGLAPRLAWRQSIGPIQRCAHADDPMQVKTYDKVFGNYDQEPLPCMKLS